MRDTISRCVPAILLSLSSLLLLSPLVPSVLAHSPYIPGDNDALDRAAAIPEPTKSWAFYADLHQGGEAQYYTFTVAEGERIYASLFVPHESIERGFMPRMVLMGPGIQPQGSVPDYVLVPAGAGTMVLEAGPIHATYEPFTPTVIYDLASVDLPSPATGAYYLAVFEPSQGGKYGLAVGTAESFTIAEWLLIPVNLLSIYRWEGQSPVLVFAPLATTLAIGIIVLFQTRMTLKAPDSLFGWLGALAGLFMLGSAASVLYQMSVALSRAPANAGIALTVILAALPALLGLGALRLSLKKSRLSKVRRAITVLIGIAALFAWSGLIIGPVLALASAFMPASRSGRVEK